MNDYSKTPLVELITQMEYLEREIDIKLLMYEEMRKEVIKRFPPLEDEEVFKEKTLVRRKKC